VIKAAIAVAVGLAVSVPSAPPWKYNEATQDVTVTGIAMWTCHVPEHSAKVLSLPVPGMIRGMDVMAYRMSRDYKTFDTLLIYGMVNKKHSAFPVYYVYDLDRDGNADTAYADEMGNGICQQMTKVDVKTLIVDKAPAPPAHEGEEQCHEGEGDSDNPKKEL
jgi:hypothetical protein